MKKLFKVPLYVLSFLIVTIGTVSVEAQEFRGFYGSNRTANYSGNASRYYKPNYSKHYRNRVANSPSVYYGGNPAINAAGFFIQPFQGFYPSTYPPASIIINILPAGTTPGHGMYNYYNGSNRYGNNWRDQQLNEGQGYNNYNPLPYGSRTVKINGDWFYEIDGNYYRADNTRNRSNRNTGSGRYEVNRYNTRGSYDNDDRVVYVTDRNSRGNATYRSDKKQAAKGVYVDNSYEGESPEYSDTRQVDRVLLLSAKEQQALKAENEHLREAAQQRLANEKKVMDAERKRQMQQSERAKEELDDTRKRSLKEIESRRERQNRQTTLAQEELNDVKKRSVREIEAERKRQIKENRQAAQELNNIRKQNAQQIEQARRDKKALEDKRARAQQEADREYEKQQVEAARNNATTNELYSNLKIGDRVNQIPENSREIKIDGKKTYVSPQNVYYRKQQGKYRVVGMR
jgi:hypothetical protein